MARSDMPHGWTTFDGYGSGPINLGCLGGLSALENASKSVMIDYVDYDLRVGGPAPSVQEYLEASTPREASNLYAKYVRILNRCRRFEYAEDGFGSLSASVGEAPLLTFGTESRAYAVDFGSDAMYPNFDLAIFRIGPYVGNVAYEDFAPDDGTLETIVTDAIDKVEGKAGPSPNY